MRSFAVLFVSVVLFACHDDSSSAPAPQPAGRVVNRGLAAERIFGSGDLRFVIASEGSQGLDLDGDGDKLDPVLQVLDLETGTLFNTGLAVPPRLRRDEVPPPEIGCSDVAGVFLVDELVTGSDADGDGNSDEFSSWSFNRRTGLLEALPFGYSEIELEGELAALVGFESGQLALRVLDGRDASVTLIPAEPMGLLAVGEDVVAFGQAELGAVDLNLDGDTLDSAVMQLYDAQARQLVNTAFQTDDIPSFAAGFVAFNVPEAQQGADLDGDGSATGRVLVAQDLRTGLVRVPPLPGALLADPLRGDTQRFLLLGSEADGDRNGDGDVLDTVAAVYDPRTDSLLDTGLATSSILLSAGRWIGVLVSEGQQGGQDLDGDGLANASVLHAFDTRTGAVVNLGFAALYAAATEGHLLALRDERVADWNGDGDQADLVLFDWSARTRSARNTGYAVGAFWGSAGEALLVTVLEDSQGADLNGDGDREDFVLALYDGRSATMNVLGLALLSNEARLAHSGRAAMLVSEAAQGADLNGDGDRLDQVLHTLEF